MGSESPAWPRRGCQGVSRGPERQESRGGSWKWGEIEVGRGILNGRVTGGGREEKKKRRRSHAKGKCFKVLVRGQGTQKEVTGRGQSIEEVLGVMKRCQLLWPL